MLTYAETASSSTIVPVVSVPQSQRQEHTTNCTSSLSASSVSSSIIGLLDCTQISPHQAQASPSSDVPLFAQEQFHLMISQLPTPTSQQDQDLVKRARKGESQARHALIERTLRYITKIAYKYAGILLHDEYLDLISEAVVAVVEKLDKALGAEDPLNYLFGTAKREIFMYCRKHRSLISNRSSCRLSDPVYQVSSLDAPLYHDDEKTLAECLALPEPAEPEPAQDYTDLYQAVERLAPVQYEVITRHYGLGGRPAETLAEIAESRDPTHGQESLAQVCKAKQRALGTLRSRLTQRSTTPAQRKQGPWAKTEQRLAQASAELVAQGIPLSVRQLAKRAGVQQRTGRKWLEAHQLAQAYHNEQARRQQARHQVLLAVYSELAAASASPVTIGHLAERTQMSRYICREWMVQQGLSIKAKRSLTDLEKQRRAQAQERRAQEREQRLSQAYAELLVAGTVTREALAQRAHVHVETARLWLRARREQEAGR